MLLDVSGMVPIMHGCSHNLHAQWNRARGNVKRKLGNYKDALRDLNRANDLSPQSSWILGYVPAIT